jgi:predicted RNA-binding Zn ribbon-like protein
MSPLFIGSHPAIDFLNTAFAPDGEPIETIGDGHAYLNWLVSAGLLPQTEAARLTRRFGVKGLDAAAAEARRVRDWAKEWLDRWRIEPKGDYTDEIAALNKLLARRTQHLEVVPGQIGMTVVEQSRIESADALLALIAGQIALLVTQDDPSLVKHCAGTACTLWFLDRTKSHRRLFCSASACGNRAKVAAFRERQRQ